MYKNFIIRGKILCKSGLHIGGGEQGIKIGGIDSPVIRNPLTDEPYIPGSSLKGKIRFLLEHAKGLVDSQDHGNIPKLRVNGRENEIAVLFGHLEHEKEQTLPTRVIFRDAQVCGAYEDFTSDNIDPAKLLSVEEAKIRMNSVFSEAKTEVLIDRLSGTAKRGGLRTMERVPAGTVFEFEIVLRLFKEEDEKFKKVLFEGLQLLENDSLGGFGSRGAGRIKFFDLIKIENGKPTETSLSEELT